MTNHQLVTIIFIDQCTWRSNSSLWDLVCWLFRVSSTRYTFQFHRCYILLSIPQIPRRLLRDVSTMSRFQTRFRLVSPYQLWTNMQQHTILPLLFFYTRKHIDSHYTDSCLSTIKYPSTQSIDNKLVLLPRWWCCSVQWQWIRSLFCGRWCKLRERCRNLGQLGMIWNHGTTHIIIAETKFNL